MRYETETHLGIRTKPNKVQLSYKDIDVKKLKKKLIEKREQKEKNKQEQGPLFNYDNFKEVKKISRVPIKLDKCNHRNYSYEKFTTKIYKVIKSDKNSEIVFRRYQNRWTLESHYQIVKYYLCNKCNQFKICSDMSAIDLNHKEFTELMGDLSKLYN